MSYMCPLCNALQSHNLFCAKCNMVMNDMGRYMDFFDDYSPYLEIDGMKKADGLHDDWQEHRCPHVFNCPLCGEHQLQIIEEKYLP